MVKYANQLQSESEPDQDPLFNVLQMNYSRSTDQKEEKSIGQKSSINPMDQEKEEKVQVYHQESDFELQEFEEHYMSSEKKPHESPSNVPEPNPTESLHQSQNSSSEDLQIDQQNPDNVEDLRMRFVKFLNSINQPNGLVFDEKDREQLNTIYPKHPKMFDTIHQLDPDGQELQKIIPEINQLIIFNKNYHKNNFSDKQFAEDIKEDVAEMTELFKQASFIFCREVTSELYSILRKLCNLAIEFRNKQDPDNPHKSEDLKQRLREFGRKIVSQDDKEHEYFFFSFKFLDFPVKKLKNGKEKKIKKQRIPPLEQKFRDPATEFMRFTQNTGIYLLVRHLRKLKSYASLI